MPHVLVIEPDEELRTLLVHVLERTGFSVQAAPDAAAGLACARARRPDMMLVDRLLPVLRTDALLQACQTDAHLRDVPVVVLSSVVDPVPTDAATESRVRAYIPKPVRPPALVTTVARTLGMAISTLPGSTLGLAHTRP